MFAEFDMNLHVYRSGLLTERDMVIYAERYPAVIFFVIDEAEIEDHIERGEN
jgi:hypothetical protein